MNTLSSIHNNIEQKISTPAGLTRATAGILAIPAIYISPKLLMMPHPITCYVVGINFASIFTALIYGEQTYLTPSLYITG